MNINKPYQICTKTIMDTSDPNIFFDESGISDYYHNFQNVILPNWHTDEKGYAELMQVAEKIKKEGETGDLIGKIGQVLVPLEKSVFLKNNKKVEKMRKR